MGCTGRAPRQPRPCPVCGRPSTRVGRKTCSIKCGRVRPQHLNVPLHDYELRASKLLSADSALTVYSALRRVGLDPRRARQMYSSVTRRLRVAGLLPGARPQR